VTTDWAGTAPDEGAGKGEPPSEPGEARRWRRVRALFEEAAELDESEWPALLARAPEGDRELLARLLAGDRTGEPLLDATPGELAADLLPLAEPLPDRLGHYRILRVLGRGGMGQVLLARRDDGCYDQDVAIKLVRRGMDSEDVLRRFRAERRILAGLTHPNIARLLDGGMAEDGRPYFVLEHVPGAPITDYCRTHHLPMEARLRLFETVCSAVQHAHERGIVHRDLKPRNIIVAEATPPAAGMVKLLDFGIAKLLEPGRPGLTPVPTLAGSRLMTPEYASPEQLAGGPVDPASDVYSLGILLYELMTGQRPYEPEALPAAEGEPIVRRGPPRRRSPGGPPVPAALLAIARMALRKEADRRYPSAGELGDDVRRYLAGEAVQARGDSVPYRVGTFLRRRTAALALGVAVLGVGVGIGGIVLARAGLPGPAVGVDLAEPLAVAVLPFRYAGPEGHEYLGTGFQAALDAQFAAFPALTVVAPGGMDPYQEPVRTTGELGAELGVAYILGGSVRFDRPGEASGRVLVIPELVRVADNTAVWSRAFEGEMEELFTLQSTVGSEVVQALGVAPLDGGPGARASGTTTDLEAYQFYLRGNDFLRFNEDEGRLRLAEASYLQAVARDSTYAEAWAKLSATHTQMWFHRYDPSDERLERARDAAERALRHHPGLPESYYALGMFQYQGLGDLRQAQRYFERALELRPNHVSALTGLATVLRRQGRFEAALSHFEQLAVLDPLDPGHLFSVAFTEQLLRNYDESEEWYAAARERGADLTLLYAAWARMRLSRTGSVAEARDILEQGAGAAVDNDFTRVVQAELDLMSGRHREVLLRTAAWATDVLDTQAWYLPVAWVRAGAYRGLGETDSARVQEQIALRLLEERVRTHPADARAHGALGKVYATLGRPDQAVRSAKMGVELMPFTRDAVLAPFRVEDLAAVYVLNGQADEAITELEALLSIPGFLSARHLHADPFWAPLKGHPRFPPET
jgi:eukaryotic-like serine/threonine-protein kinase